MDTSLPVVILAGGRGTRLEEETKGAIPKPLVSIGDRPMLEHIIGIYARQGFKEFIVAAGYKWDLISDWTLVNKVPSRVGVIDTGLETKTGGRLRQIQELLQRRFLLTYGDGLADINLAALLDFHERSVAKHGVLATLTAVRPPSRWGALSITAGLAEVFVEKPQSESGWINGGFYVVEPAALDLIPHDGTMWEYDVLPVLAMQQRLAAYQHTGWWQCLDTPRELAMLNELWNQDRAPWAR